MINGKDIVMVSIQPWDIEIGSNSRNITRIFAKNNRVLYVNPPVDFFTHFRYRSKKKVQRRIEVLKGRLSDIEKIDSNIWNLHPNSLVVPINWINSHRLFKKLNQRNAKAFAMNIKSAVERLGFKDYILFNDSSMFLGLHLKKHLKPDLYTYYVRDNLIKVPYFQKHGERLEPYVIEQADVVVNNSEYYTDYSSKYNKNSIMVGQGCDLSVFKTKVDDNVPKDLKPIKGPIIGYVGSLTTLRLDVDILKYIASERPNWSIVLIGPEDENFKDTQLHQIKNIHFLGFKEIEALSSYVSRFDVAMNPQVVNEITIGNYPRKIDEYLALGKPVVATHTRAMDMFSDYVYLANTKEDYVTLIEKALVEHTSAIGERQRVFAFKHTWEHNVNNIYEAMGSTISQLQQ